jgi:hypothetical protein
MSTMQLPDLDALRRRYRLKRRMNNDVFWLKLDLTSRVRLG